MLAKKHHPWIFILNILIFSAVLLFDINGIIDISIKNATPLILIPVLTAFSVFYPLNSAVVAGILSGAMLDCVASGTYCFNTVSFFIMGAVVSLAANNLFNKNIRSAAALSLITSVLYYTAYWICFHSFGAGIENSLIYLLSYALPSAVYSAVFVFPFYWIFRKFAKTKGYIN